MNISKEAEWKFFTMYKQIADAMQTQTNAFTIEDPDLNAPRALNLCLAPGGYTKKLLDMYPTIQISGITLAPSEGGHEVLVEDPRLHVEYLDMNLLPLEYGVPLLNLPPNHPDAARFLLTAPFPSQTFNLVFADGAVLRTHSREVHRADKDREALRLRVAQLIFGLSRLKAGGTFVILLHRIDSFENLVLLRNFEQFAKVSVFKPEKIYTQSSSFYLIAKDVQPTHPVAVQVLEKWKKVWQTITFGGEDGTGTSPEEPSSERVSQALESYGPRFVELGAQVWQIQARGLANASYIQPRSNSKPEGSYRLSRPAPLGAAEEKAFPRYTGGLTWLSKSTNGANDRPAGASKENRPLAANLSSWRS